MPPPRMATGRVEEELPTEYTEYTEKKAGIEIVCTREVPAKTQG